MERSFKERGCLFVHWGGNIASAGAGGCLAKATLITKPTMLGLGYSWSGGAEIKFDMRVCQTENNLVGGSIQTKGGYGDRDAVLIRKEGHVLSPSVGSNETLWKGKTKGKTSSVNTLGPYGALWKGGPRGQASKGGGLCPRTRGTNSTF